MGDRTGILPMLQGISPDQMALVVRSSAAGHALRMMRWGSKQSCGCQRVDKIETIAVGN